MEGLSITRHDNGANGEYRAHVPGSDAVGRLTWYLEDGVKVADHTLVPPEIGNRGVAAKLVEALIGDAQRDGFKVRPLCSYVAVAFKRHPEWAAVLA